METKVHKNKSATDHLVILGSPEAVIRREKAQRRNPSIFNTLPTDCAWVSEDVLKMNYFNCFNVLIAIRYSVKYCNIHSFPGILKSLLPQERKIIIT